MAHFNRHGNFACRRHGLLVSGELASLNIVTQGPACACRFPQTLAATATEPFTYLAEQGMGVVPLPDCAMRDPIAKGSLLPVLSECASRTGVARTLSHAEGQGLSSIFSPPTCFRRGAQKVGRAGATSPAVAYAAFCFSP